MYIGKEAFTPAPDEQSARQLFARSVQRVEVETHSYCNRRCDYCPNATDDRRGENRRIADEPWFLLLRNLGEIDYAGSLVFSGYNEPLADRFILQRIREACAQVPRARTMIYTNGDYLTPAYLAELAAAGLHHLHVSNHVRRGDKYAEVPVLNSIFKLVQRLGATVHFETMKANEYIVASVPHASMQIEIRAINYWLHGTSRGGLVDGIAAPTARTLPCYFPFTHFQLGFGGTVVPCCQIRSDSDAHKPYHYGNLLDFGSIFAAYASRIAAEWRRHLISPDPKQKPCDTCQVAFLNMKPEVIRKAHDAWERYVRTQP